MVNRVTGIGSGVITPRPKTAAATGSFTVSDNGPAPAVQENQPTQNVALSGMLALQEAETTSLQDKAARRHGFALLEALSSLQKTLLTGLGDRQTEITTLTQLATEMPQAADPGLTSVLDAVRLRAKIELLRRGVEIT